MDTLAIQKMDNSHFNKDYLDNRRILLAYGEFMNGKKKKFPAVTVACQTPATLGAVSTCTSTLAEIFSCSNSRMVFENSNPAVGNFEKIRYFTVEAEEEQRERQLKATGYIAYCRERALEEAARKGNGPFVDEPLPIGNRYEVRSKPVASAKANKCTTLAISTAHRPSSSPDHEEKVRDHGGFKRKMAAKMKKIRGVAVASAKMIRSEIRKGFR